MNVIVLINDSLRADHVGCYGSNVKTPNIDRLAAEGVKFTRAYSENLPTLPTRRDWWTGKHHFHCTRSGRPAETDYLLAEVLWDRGYTSALITDVYHMHKPTHAWGRGFDTTVFIRGQVDKVRDMAFGGHRTLEWYAVTEQWSYLLPINGSRPPELYNLEDDPAEQHNIVREHPDVAAAMVFELRRFVGALG